MNWRRAVERAAAYREAGAPWRAREVLQGAVAWTYHPVLYRAYGEALFHLGDRYAAGKFLFLAGVSPAEEPYGAAVRLFQQRHERTSGATLAGLLPNAFRQADPQRWPEPTLAWLTAKVCPQPTPCPDPRQALRRAGLWRPVEPSEKGLPAAQKRWIEWGCALALLYLLVSALLGTGWLCFILWRILTGAAS